MIGAGTGIAPFRSFWQERQVDMEMNLVTTDVNGKCFGEMILFFGCRYKGVHELYRSEIDELVKQGVISKYYPAYSRESKSGKYYVQDAVAKHGKEVYEAIVKRNGHVYICGQEQMAADAAKTLEVVLYKHSHMKLEEVKVYLNEMKDNHRLHEDIFGNNVKKIKSEI